LRQRCGARADAWGEAEAKRAVGLYFVNSNRAV
jgi:hypothetical protein